MNCKLVWSCAFNRPLEGSSRFSGQIGGLQALLGAYIAGVVLGCMRHVLPGSEWGPDGKGYTWWGQSETLWAVLGIPY